MCVIGHKESSHLNGIESFYIPKHISSIINFKLNSLQIRLFFQDGLASTYIEQPFSRMMVVNLVYERQDVQNRRWKSDITHSRGLNICMLQNPNKLSLRKHVDGQLRLHGREVLLLEEWR